MKPIASAKRRRRQGPRPLTCQDLAEQGRWDLALCCAECHADESLLVQDTLTAPNPLEGQRQMLICCRAFLLLNDWYAGKHYDSLPEHE
jgi:hypothetical protein